MTRRSSLGFPAGAALIFTDDRVSVSRSQGGLFGPPTELMKAVGAPDACSLRDEVAVAWHGRGRGRGLNLSFSQRGVFGEPVVYREARYWARVCGLGDDLVVAWREAGWVNVGFARSGSLVPALRLLDRPLQRGLCAHDGGVVLAWPAEDHRITVARLRRAG